MLSGPVDIDGDGPVKPVKHLDEAWGKKYPGFVTCQRGRGEDPGEYAGKRKLDNKCCQVHLTTEPLRHRERKLVDQFLIELEPSISLARLKRYQSPTGDDLETAVNYLWNVALAESLFCSLNAVEIALRNALHGTLTNHFGVPAWYERPGLLEIKQARDITAVKKRIREYGDPITPDRAVSELTFGFWVVILSRPYDARLWQGQNAAPLKNAFMRIPRQERQRQTIHQQYTSIRELRNRVFHYEPVFNDQHLAQRYGQIKHGLRWLNPRMVDCLEWYDRFPDVYHNGRTRVESKLKAELGIA